MLLAGGLQYANARRSHFNSAGSAGADGALRSKWLTVTTPALCRRRLFSGRLRDAAHRSAQRLRRGLGEAPAVRPTDPVGPVLGAADPVAVIDLLDLGGVFHHQPVGLPEIGVDVVARPVAPDA